MNDPNLFAEELAEAREDKAVKANQLREANYYLAVEKARAERVIIEQAGGVKGLGSNEAERARNLTIALAELPLESAYQEMLVKQMQAQAAYEWACVQLDAMKDARRDYENVLRFNEVMR